MIRKVAEARERSSGYVAGQEEKLRATENAADLYAKGGEHEKAAHLYLQLAVDYSKAGESDRANDFFHKAFSRAGIAAKVLSDAGKHERAAEMYANFAERFDTAGRNVEAGSLYQGASAESDITGDKGNAGKYAGIAARRFERESLNTELGPSEQARYARKASENYSKVVTFSKAAGKITAGIERTIEQLQDKAKELDEEAAKRKKTGKKGKT
jgi:hypothetical protein